MLNKKSIKSKGYNLVEVLATLLIVGVAAAVAIVLFEKNSDNVQGKLFIPHFGN